MDKIASFIEKKYHSYSKLSLNLKHMENFLKKLDLFTLSLIRRLNNDSAALKEDII